VAEPKIRVVVVDDQPLFSAGIAMLLDAQADMGCVGTASNGAEAVELVRNTSPDVVLMDLRMPVVNGLDATRTLLAGGETDDPPSVIVLTTIRKDEAVVRAMAAGASGYLTKDATPQQVLASIRTAHAGEELPLAATGLVAEFSTRSTSRRDETLAVLSPREREVFLLLARGLSNAEIAEAAWVTEATVKSHTRSVLQKLGLRSRAQVVVFAYENGLVSA
jgi:DNA-binding NarL/FixJ family response regulator